MDRLQRTRSQHFVSSPRKTASPLIARHTLYHRHPPKKRRLGVTTFVASHNEAGQDYSNGLEDDLEKAIMKRGESSSAPAGRTSRSRSQSRPVRQKSNDKVSTYSLPNGQDDEDVPSPKKRKRSRAGSLSTEDSWVETTEDEWEPDFIAEGDRNLIHYAPSTALHRLRKAELVRLWKVAGMWDSEDIPDDMNEDETIGDMGKKELVDGLIAARKHQTRRLISPLPSSPNRPIRRQSTLSPIPATPPPSSPLVESSSPDVTPKPRPRTRSRVRLETPIVRRQPRPSRPTRTLTKRHTKSEARSRRVRAQLAKKVNGKSENGDESELTELSDSDDDANESTPIVKRLRPRGVGGRKSFMKEPSTDITDFEDDAEEADAEATEVEEEPPQPKGRKLRSKSISQASLSKHGSDIDMAPASGQISPKSLPTRGAKKKAIQRMQGGESGTEDEDMEMDEDRDIGMEEGTPMPQPATPPRKGCASRLPTPKLDEDSAMVGSPTPSVATETEAATPRPVHTTRSGKAFGAIQNRRRQLLQEARNDPDMDEEDESDEEDGEPEPDIDLSEATVASLIRLLRDELVQMCEARGIEVGGTKPQLAKALLEWRDEQKGSYPSSTSTARPSPPRTAMPRRKSKSKSKSRTKSKFKSNKHVPAIGTAVHAPGKPTPVLLRSHVHANDPETPPLSKGEEGDVEEEKKGTEAELNLDLQELGLEDSVIKPSHLTKLEKIGSGGFKDVYVGKFRGRKVAISEFRSHLSEMDIRELKLLAEFSHPNIVRFRGICIPEDSTHVPCMLVSELCENGDLFDYIRNVPCPTLKRLLSLMLDIARGLEYLHTRKPSIIHRDCKSSNILINRSGVAKVGDFGLARVKNSTRSMIRSLVGTVNWQAPELWHPTPRYDYKVDVFSAGMVYWEMMSGWIGEKKYPWEGHNEHYIYDAVGTKHRRPPVTGMRKHWGSEPVNLMERMWHQDPAERPTMTDVVHDLESMLAELK
ncbi:TKL-group protein kinase [Cryptococcus neoformans]|nr:TKL-group protein kinase [Cryptococcus neoformans var. grubii]